MSEKERRFPKGIWTLLWNFCAAIWLVPVLLYSQERRWIPWIVGALAVLCWNCLWLLYQIGERQFKD